MRDFSKPETKAIYDAEIRNRMDAPFNMSLEQAQMLVTVLMTEPPKETDDHAESPLICPVTCQPCMTEEDEFCEDYGCARKAGIDVDRDLIP